MDNQDSLLFLYSKHGTGTLNNLTYNLKFLKQLQKDYDLLIGLREIHINENLIEILATRATIQWVEIKYPSDIRNCTATLATGYYTIPQLIGELEAKMKAASIHTIIYTVTFDINGFMNITTNKVATDKQFVIDASINNAWQDLGFEIRIQTQYVTTIKSDFRLYYNPSIKLDISTNLIKPTSYSTVENNFNNTIISEIDVTNPLIPNDFFNIYIENPTFVEANTLNSQSFYIKFTNTGTSTLFTFKGGTTYSLTFVIRQKYKASIIRKSLTITKKEIIELVQQMVKEKEKAIKKNVEKKLIEKKTIKPKKANKIIFD